jgi:hypothetical protein
MYWPPSPITIMRWRLLRVSGPATKQTTQTAMAAANRLAFCKLDLGQFLNGPTLSVAALPPVAKMMPFPDSGIEGVIPRSGSGMFPFEPDQAS